MTVDDYNAFCASLLHTHHVVQWGGAHVWKVGGGGQLKVFAIRGWEGPGLGGISFKCSPMSFQMLKAEPGIRPAPYLASRGMSWLQSTSAETLDAAALKTYVAESHRLASLNLTRKLQRELGLNTA